MELTAPECRLCGCLPVCRQMVWRCMLWERMHPWGLSPQYCCVVVLQLEGASESPGRLVKTQIDVVHPYSGILFNHTKESSIGACHNVDEL